MIHLNRIESTFDSRLMSRAQPCLQLCWCRQVAPPWMHTGCRASDTNIPLLIPRPTMVYFITPLTWGGGIFIAGFRSLSRRSRGNEPGVGVGQTASTPTPERLLEFAGYTHHDRPSGMIFIASLSNCYQKIWNLIKKCPVSHFLAGASVLTNNVFTQNVYYIVNIY